MLNAETRHEERWADFWRVIGAEGDSKPAYLDLRTRYLESHRKYHTWKHIVDGLEEFEPVQGLALHPEEVKLAYYFHDAIYDTKVKDSINVGKSAELARLAMEKAKLPEGRIKRVEELVLVTKHNDVPMGIDSELMVDIDLSILGKPAEEFNLYERNIRQEYGWVDEKTFRFGRAQILERILERPQIFNTPYFVNKYEVRARNNLARSFKNLSP